MEAVEKNQGNGISDTSVEGDCVLTILTLAGVVRPEFLQRPSAEKNIVE